MADTEPPACTSFEFGDIRVEILQGNILEPGVSLDAVVSTDDNYMTMGSGLSARLRELAGTIEYAQAAQEKCPVQAGSVVVTAGYGLTEVLGVKHVLHGAVIDYDTDLLSLPELVEQTTANCLQRAEGLGVQSILFPAFATGAGGLSMEDCALRMGSAIKAYVGQERQLKRIYILLHLPAAAEAAASGLDPAACSALNARFIRQANLVLGVPYDPTSPMLQARDFYSGRSAQQKLAEIISGQHDGAGGKRHAVILGGPFAGKQALLDHLYYQSQQSGSPLSAGRRLVRLTFGRVHENTPASFVYRKFLCALEAATRHESSATQTLALDIRQAYSDPELDCERFLALLQRHPEQFAEVVFLIDKLPRLLQMEARDRDQPKGIQAFWKDLDQLQSQVRFVYTARPAEYERLRELRLDPYASDFQSCIETVWVTCVSEQEREEWVNDWFRRYLDRPDGAPRFVHDWFQDQAGRHPYLICLAGFALILALKRDLLTNPRHPGKYTRSFMARFFQAAGNAVEKPRRSFFEQLLGPVTRAERQCLEGLAKAVLLEEEKRVLLRGIRKGEAKAKARWAELQAGGDPRQALDGETLRWLEAQGYVVDVEKRAQLLASSFAAWLAEYFGLKRHRAKEGQPADVEVTLLCVGAPPSPHGVPAGQQKGPLAIRTMFRGRGARIVSAEKELHEDDRRTFVEGLSQCLNHLLHPLQYPDPGWLHSPEQAGSYILTQFATSEIKKYLQDPPPHCTISFEVDDALKDIPWELMLETAYTGEIPFRVGRRIFGQQPANICSPVCGPGKVKALLIGDPGGNLPEAQEEVLDLAERLSCDGRFEPPDVLLGPARCQPGAIALALGSRQYGLIHYAGHTHYDGYRSAWQLAGGKLLTTDRLTSALQMGPPALVFSSSCQSAVGAEPQPIRYENQTFDLPSAFLQAGVEAYIGTLWEVESAAARYFVEAFYEALLCGTHNLGECLRRAKWARKQDEERQDDINWLSFILYGDPHLMPGELFPVMCKP